MHIKDSELTAQLASQLNGTPLTAAAYARVHTSLSAARMLTPLGNYLVARPAARAAAKKITAETDVPLDAAMVLGITADALHVWKADPMMNQVHDHMGSVPLEKISAISVVPGKSWQELTLTLVDGKTVTVEARGAAHAIAAAFDARGR